jgi:hypothetical protein
MRLLRDGINEHILNQWIAWFIQLFNTHKQGIGPSTRVKRPLLDIPTLEGMGHFLREDLFLPRSQFIVPAIPDGLTGAGGPVHDGVVFCHRFPLKGGEDPPEDESSTPR